MNMLSEMVTSNKTKRLLTLYVFSSLTYLAAQELLNVFMWWGTIKFKLMFSSFHRFYFLSPIISAILIFGSYLILKKPYHPPKEHHLLYVISWAFLFIPQIIPQFFYGLNTVYVTWTFILTAVATGTVIFQDLVFVNADDVPINGKRFIYNELKFYLDKLYTALLTLGAALGVIMTILWTAPMTSFGMSYIERQFWTVYMVFCFATATILATIFIAYPIFKNIRKVKEAILGAEGKTNAPTSDNSG